ncbi:Alpha/Beta hydrolase protein [Roridomyces roridus]|uniref:Alpha/Beta hydrolase protein n=1 Tax=Roridomyces roridus TaxID=1738132 RepID=A0AAD7CBU9_9AGAR|nr:Alpha/Beta hydrolase protein [Roridomyces roridus]
MPQSTSTPFTIAIPESTLTQLHQKLALTTLPDELDDAGWDYGVPLADIRRLLVRWRDGYDWRVHETQLNATLGPQFTRPIQVEGHGTLEIHYIHQRSEVEGAIPLLFVHGWPGSIIEARKLVPLLTKKAPRGEHLDSPRQYAEVGNKLMLALGYNEYVTQGGDWGSPITRTIAAMYGGKHSKAWHTNMVPGIPPPPDANEQNLTPKERAGLERVEWFRNKGHGYFVEQSTQPQTLGYALADSPVGLLAWIYEKLVNWTDGYPWEDDEVLTWISIFLFSRAGPAASLRIYYEYGMNPVKYDDKPPTIPLGVSRFPRDINVFPKSWSKGIGNIVFDEEHDGGGHFAAYEKPHELAGDLRKMFGKRSGAFGVVSGQSGYDSIGVKAKL